MEEVGRYIYLFGNTVIYKIGLELITSVGGPQIVRYIQARGGTVFYDEKFDDIPETIARASRAVSHLGVHMFDVHASAGEKSIEAAVRNKGKSKLLGVTVLTSIDMEECVSIFGNLPGNKVLQFALMLEALGADGIVCSPEELMFLNGFEKLKRLIKITPGVRPKWASKDDQARVMTPLGAINAGADYLVIGRPITMHSDPVEALRKINEEIASGL